MDPANAGFFYGENIMTKELKEFSTDYPWQDKKHILVITAHPDDEDLIAWGALNYLIKAGISITVLTLTLGELGETKDKQNISPVEMGKIREKEFYSSTKARGLQSHKRLFPDTGLSRPDILEQAKHEALEFVRENKFGVIFSFHPFEITPEFDHPDHNAAGEIARYVSAVSAARNLHTDALPLESRSSLYLWTSNPEFATHRILFTPKMEKDRKIHLAKYYQSQFPGDSMNRWGVIFDGIARGIHGDLPAQEMFMKVR